MGRSTKEEIGLSEQRKHRSWTAQQKLEIVLAGLCGDRSVRDVCREHEISEALFYGWREKLLEGGREALAGKEERQRERELRRKVAELERALGRKTYELVDPGPAMSHAEPGAAALYFRSVRGPVRRGRSDVELGEHLARRAEIGLLEPFAERVVHTREEPVAVCSPSSVRREPGHADCRAQGK